MNGRLGVYPDKRSDIGNPVTSRFLCPDNFIFDATFSQSYNRYSYCLNNPLVYTDPSGEIFWMIPVAIAIWAATTQSGYEVQKYISPVAVHPDIHLGSEQKGVVLDVSVGVPKALPVSARVHVGATYYWDYYDGAYKGWEGRYGAEVTLEGMVSYSPTRFDMRGSKFDQTVGQITIGGPFVNFKYENDYMFGLPADGGDRYRTAAARLKIGPFTAGVNLFTGDPGLQGGIRETFLDPDYNNRETYKENQYGDNPNEYRAGVFYVGFGPFKFGHNSEKNRHMFQNQFAHDFMMGSKSPYFQVAKTRKPKWYWYFGTGTGNSLW